MVLSRKIETNSMDSLSYHKIKERLSSSAIRVFMDNRISFMKQFVLGETPKEKRSYWIDIGHMVHCLLLEGQQVFDTRYTLSRVGTPIGQMKDLVDNLYEISKKSMSEDDGKLIQKREFEELFMDAVQMTKFDFEMNEVAFKGKDPKAIVALFTKPDKNGVTGESYYQELLKNTNTTVVSESMLVTVEKVVEELKNSSVTSDIALMRDEDGIRHVYREQCIFFRYMDIDMKAAIDQNEVNHQEKYIQPYDYKIQYDNTIMEYAYIKNAYWVPVATYDAALRSWAIENGYENYEIRPMILIAADSSNEYTPIIYKLNQHDVENGYNGFKLDTSNKWHPGINETISEIHQHLETGNWRASIKCQKNNGILSLEIPYK